MRAPVADLHLFSNHELVGWLAYELVLTGRTFLLLYQQTALLVTAELLLVVGRNGTYKLSCTLLLKHVQWSW